MGIMTIDGQSIEFTDEPNVLSVIRKAGIDIPTLCYHSELSIYGACRLCTVENDRGKTFASCSEKPKDGMVIYTNTPRLMRYRKLILELLLAAHCRDCTTCIKSGECHLQELAHRMGVHEIRFENVREQQPIDTSSHAIIRDPNKCILCGDCVRMCDNVQNINAIDFAYRGTDAQVMPAFNKKIAETDCVGCGQCRVVCPTGAISIHTNIDAVWEALADKNTKVIAQIAPAVRVAIGDHFGYAKGENVMGKLVGVLHRLGFDEVYDTSYGADLTVVEESKEFIERFTSGQKMPLFTSCCPAWVKYCETKYPEFVPNLSTCRSPQQMFGAVVREYYKDPEKNEGKKIVSVSIMPCTAKKEEILRPESFTNGKQDVDYVLTTTEVVRMIRKSGIVFDKVEIEAADVPFGIGSGSGVIFGVTGGVTEAVLRRLQQGHSRVDMEAIKKSGVRGDEGIKTLTYDYNGREIRAAVVNGLANADKLLQQIKNHEVEYDFVEVMACRRGCIMGGGQPVNAGPRTRKARMKGLYDTDVNTQIKKSNENPMILSLYDSLLKGKEHELLHRNFSGK
ncbi:MAG: [FeFe] hydrogenase, group A [Clostridium sp.]